MPGLGSVGFAQARRALPGTRDGSPGPVAGHPPQYHYRVDFLLTALYGPLTRSRAYRFRRHVESGMRSQGIAMGGQRAPLICIAAQSKTSMSLLGSRPMSASGILAHLSTAFSGIAIPGT